VPEILFHVCGYSQAPAASSSTVDIQKSTAGSPCGAGSRCAEEADQLLVRTGEMTRAQGVRTPLGNFGAVARYLPALSGMRIS
jgi:hypothetical protein